jgi:hypothetical protein
MNEDWHPISEDGKRMVTVNPFGYAIYSVDEPFDPKAETRTFIHRGVVGEFEYAEQWLNDGIVRGPVVKIVMPRPAKAKSGASA